MFKWISRLFKRPTKVEHAEWLELDFKWQLDYFQKLDDDVSLLIQKPSFRRGLRHSKSSTMPS